MHVIPRYDYSDKNINKLIASVLSDIGFVVITNLGISKETINDAYRAWQAFFYSDDRRLYSSGDKIPKGFYDYWQENVEFKQIGVPKESFYYNLTDPLLDVHKEIFKPINKLFTQLDRLSKDVLLMLSNYAKDSTKADMTRILGNKLYKSLRGIYSPPLETESYSMNNSAPKIRNPAHQDIDIITLLPTATQPGLQVLLYDKWIDVVSAHGDIIINNGDTLNLLSNGFYKSTTHRVIYSPSALDKERYAMAFFVAPSSS